MPGWHATIPYFVSRKRRKATGKQRASSCQLRILRLVRSVVNEMQDMMLYPNRCRCAILHHPRPSSLRLLSEPPDP